MIQFVNFKGLFAVDKLNDFIHSFSLSKNNIISIFPEHNGSITLCYFVEEVC